MRKFKIGERVMLNKAMCSQGDLDRYGSEGEFDKVYIVSRVNSEDCRLDGNNWHKHYWLKIASVILIGGE